MSSERITFDNVSRFYGQVLGVNRVTLSIPPGITSLVGPNGSGKTTPPNGNAYNIPFAGTYSVDAGGLAGWTMLSGHEVNIGSFNGPGGTVEQWTLYPDAGQFAVQATAVPEPSTYAVIAGVAMLGVAFVQRRRRSAA